jgi:xylulokinase
MYLLGYDIGSSSIKAAITEAATGNIVAIANYPATEMLITAPQIGWAEQDPNEWWHNIAAVTKLALKKAKVKASAIQAIGIAYQMHGLVLLDAEGEVLRPSIIWCDSRAVSIGNQAFSAIGKEKCLSHVLNSPGNFTASKLRWVRENEPDLYARIATMMLPGDYIAYQLTGERSTSITGLSEGILWDFAKNEVADLILNHYELDKKFIPKVRTSFEISGRVTAKAAKATGLAVGTPVTYRAGDQPNNAMSLNVLNAGEVAGTGGTSGVVYGVIDEPRFDPKSRVNGFAHVNHTPTNPRIGVLLCINGAGIQYAWMRRQLGSKLSYNAIEAQISAVSTNDLFAYPFGNGAERMFENKTLGAQLHGIDFNRHNQTHLFRAALEGIAFSFVYGIEILKEMGLSMNVLRVGNDNLFQSKVFSTTIASVLGIDIQLMQTTGAVGAAQAAGVAVGAYANVGEAMQFVQRDKIFEPQKGIGEHYTAWKAGLKG